MKKIAPPPKTKRGNVSTEQTPPHAARLSTHEAGHAVAAMALGIPVAFVTLDPADDDSAGLCQRGTDDEFDPEYASLAVLWSEVVFTLAGAAAEEVAGMGAPDWRRVELAGDLDNARELLMHGSPQWMTDGFVRAYTEAVALLAPRLDQVRQVADELVSCGHLDGERLRALVLGTC